MRAKLPTRIFFEFSCPHCPGDGVVRGRRPGVDWPRPCVCGASTGLTNYQVARLLEEDAKTIVRVAHLRAHGETARRVLEGLVREGLV